MTLDSELTVIVITFKWNSADDSSTSTSDSGMVDNVIEDNSFEDEEDLMEVDERHSADIGINFNAAFNSSISISSDNPIDDLMEIDPVIENQHAEFGISLTAAFNNPIDDNSSKQSPMEVDPSREDPMDVDDICIKCLKNGFLFDSDGPDALLHLQLHED